MLLTAEMSVAQPFRAWYSGKSKIVAEDTGLRIEYWNIKYPKHGGEDAAGFFDKNDSLLYFLSGGIVLSKGIDSVIFEPTLPYGFFNSVTQASFCYHDKITDTIFFIAKYGYNYNSLRLAVYKIHPNRKNISIDTLIAPFGYDEATAVYHNKNKFWVISHKYESDTFIAVDIHTYKNVISVIPNFKFNSFPVSDMRFHPSGKLFVYTGFNYNGGREYKATYINVFNFSIESGSIGFRMLFINNFLKNGFHMFDSTGKYFYTGSTNCVNIKCNEWNNKSDSIFIIQFDFNYLLNNKVKYYKLISASIEEPYWGDTRFVYGSNNRIYYGYSDSGYFEIKHPERYGIAAEAKFVPLKQPHPFIVFSSWPNAVQTGKTISDDTFTFFNLRYPTLDSFYIPNAFTPNGDGVNDDFGVGYSFSNPPLNYNMRIFNKWGQKIFESNDPEIWWLGDFNEKPCMEGSYFYIISFTSTINHNFIKRTGWVNLMR